MLFRHIRSIFTSAIIKKKTYLLHLGKKLHVCAVNVTELTCSCPSCSSRLVWLWLSMVMLQRDFILLVLVITSLKGTLKEGMWQMGVSIQDFFSPERSLSLPGTRTRSRWTTGSVCQIRWPLRLVHPVSQPTRKKCFPVLRVIKKNWTPMSKLAVSGKREY